MSITIDDIRRAGEIPESFNTIPPGVAIFYAPDDGVESHVKERVVRLFEQCTTQREDFVLDIKVETTTNRFLVNCIVARRLNLGSLLRYNLLIARMSCDESVDAFVKEFFKLHSRDDESLKFVNQKLKALQFCDYAVSAPQPVGMSIGMIVMRPPCS